MFTQDTKSSSTMSQGSRPAVGVLTQNSKTNYTFTWADEYIAWGNEARAWAGLSDKINLDIRH